MSGSETDDPTISEESVTEEEFATFVVESSTRTAVLTRLVDGPAPASEIAENRSASVAGTETNTASVSASSAENAAEELYDRGLVELLETDEMTAYCLTARGERVAFTLKEQGEI